MRFGSGTAQGELLQLSPLLERTVADVPVLKIQVTGPGRLRFLPIEAEKNLAPTRSILTARLGL
jgi:hypothetical protein